MLHRACREVPVLVDDVAKKLLKTCVFACFPAGTLIHTEHGLKNIEDIRVGDLVWAYNAETGEIALQPVINTVINESDHTIKIYTETETIETTALHPFYTEKCWKDASELQAGDKLLTKDNKKITVKQTQYTYKPKKVYNFEVAHWHTYFVGILAWLVHNAGRCLSELKHFNWGAYLTKLIGPPPKQMLNPHAHHIVFKQGRGAMIKYIDKSKAILDKYGIDWLKGKENLIWAPNKNHSTKVAKYVSEALEKADKLGGKEAVIKELKQLGEKFADDTIGEVGALF